MAKAVEMNRLKEHLEGKGQKESSIKTNISRVKKVLRELYDTEEPTLKQLKSIHTVLLTHLDTYKTSNAKKTTLMSMIHLMDAYNIQTAPLMKQLKNWTKMCDAESVANTTEDMMEKIEGVDFDAIKETIATTRDVEDRMLKACYTMLCPLRQQDWIGLKLTTKKLQDENHINMKTGKMIIYHHKSDKTHGEKEIDIPVELMKEIKIYKKRNDTDVMFNLSSSAITKRLTKIFGVSSGTLRKAYVSKYASSMNAGDLLKLADTMGHKISTQLISYRKPIKNEKEIDETDNISEYSDEPTISE